ncbi:MAG: polysaccharide pyruvyl transferase family protein [Thomasclavelia sp.]
MNSNNVEYTSGPSEFLYLIHHAKLVCTDSFHACVFSILFDTQFYVFERENEIISMNSRIDTLLRKFDLEEHRKKIILIIRLIMIIHTYMKSWKEKEKSLIYF